MSFLFLTIQGNPLRPSMGLLAFLSSFPWPCTQRYIHLNTHYFVLLRFLKHPSIMILSIRHYTDLFPCLSLPEWVVRSQQLFILYCQCKAKSFTTAYQGHVLRSQGLAYLISYHFLLAHSDFATHITLLHSNLPDTVLSRDFHWWFHYQKCFGLDSHKTRFFSFLKCCPSNEAFQLHPT